MTTSSYARSVGPESIDSLVGLRTQFTKTIDTSDVYGFAGITGDLDKNHVDLEYCRSMGWSERLVHGALLIGFTSTASTTIFSGITINVVSLGYDGIRFLLPVVVGETVTVTYEISDVVMEKARTVGTMNVFDRDRALVMVGTHLQKVLPLEKEGDQQGERVR